MPQAVRLSAALVVLALVGAGCGGETGGGSATGGQAGTGGSAATGGTAGSGATGGTSGTGGTGGCESFVPCCDANGNPVNPICPSGTPECPPGSSFPPSGVCKPAGGSCTPGQTCASDEYCDYPDNRCGAGEAGKCVKRPQGCDLMYAPVCACDGSVAGNECSAYTSGSDLNAGATCKPPQGTFACGTMFCNVGSQYCRHSTSDVGGTPDSFSCGTPPASCGATPTCACLANEPCGSWCNADASGNVTLTCPGG